MSNVQNGRTNWEEKRINQKKKNGSGKTKITTSSKRNVPWINYIVLCNVRHRSNFDGRSCEIAQFFARRVVFRPNAPQKLIWKAEHFRSQPLENENYLADFSEDPVYNWNSQSFAHRFVRIVTLILLGYFSFTSNCVHTRFRKRFCNRKLRVENYFTIYQWTNSSSFKIWLLLCMLTIFNKITCMCIPYR